MESIPMALPIGYTKFQWSKSNIRDIIIIYNQNNLTKEHVI